MVTICQTAALFDTELLNRKQKGSDGDNVNDPWLTTDDWQLWVRCCMQGVRGAWRPKTCKAQGRPVPSSYPAPPRG